MLIAIPELSPRCITIPALRCERGKVDTIVDDQNPFRSHRSGLDDVAPDDTGDGDDTADEVVREPVERIPFPQERADMPRQDDRDPSPGEKNCGNNCGKITRMLAVDDLDSPARRSRESRRATVTGSWSR